MSIPKKLLSEVLKEAKIKKKVLIISDDFDEDSFSTFKELVDEGNYYYAEESNYFSFDVEHVEDFEDIRDTLFLRKYDAYLIDYGIVGDDKDNLEMIKQMTNGIVIWCGGLNGHYNEDIKRLFPDRKYMHDLPECSIGAKDVILALYEAFNPKTHRSEFVIRLANILYKRLKNG